MAITTPTADFVTTTLSGALAQGGTSATVGAGLSLPATNGVIQISYDSVIAVGTTDGPETVFYTAYNSGTGAITGMTRGVAGTTDVAHSSGQSVQAGFSTYYLTQEPLSKVIGDYWTAYTPVWDSDGTDPVLGNGTISGIYQKIGKTIFVQVQLVFGSTSTFGTGVYNLSLPIDSSTRSLINGGATYDDISTSRGLGLCVKISNSKVGFVTQGSTAGYWGATVPHTWANGDSIYAGFSYEAT